MSSHLRTFVFGVVCSLHVWAISQAAAAKIEPKAPTDVIRQETWKGLEYWLRTTGRGFTAPMEKLEFKGFKREFYGGAFDGLKARRAEAWCAYVFDRDGTFYPAVQMFDSSRDVEELAIGLDGREIAHIQAAGNDGKSALFCLTCPIVVRRGQRLKLTCRRGVGMCRVEGLSFGTSPIVLPEPKPENIQTWSERPGEAAICWTTNRIATTGIVEYGIQGRNQRTEPLNKEGQNHRVLLTGLDPEADYQARIVSGHGGRELFSEVFRFRAAPPASGPTRPQTITLRVPEPTDQPRRDWPATIGLPFARGALAQTADLALTDPSGKTVDLQSQALSRWPDGSVSWALLDFSVSTQAGSKPVKYTVQCQPNSPQQSSRILSSGLKPAAQGWIFRRESLAIAIGEASGKLFTFRRDKLDAPVALELTTGDGVVWTCGLPEPASVAVETDGPLRSVLRFAGPMVAPDGTKAWRYLARLTAYRGQSALGVDVSLCNDQANPITSPVKSWVLRLPVGGGDIRAALGQEPPESLRAGEVLRLLQDKDDHYAVTGPRGARQAEHATGLATVAGSSRQWTVFMPNFWQTYPAGVTANPNALDVELLPRLASNLYSDPVSRKIFSRIYAWFDKGNYLFRAGQLLRRQLVIVPEAMPNDRAAREADWWSRPPRPQAPAAYQCKTGVLGRPLYVPQRGVWEAYERMFDDNFARYLANRQQNRTYGWMHFGDWFGERGFNYGNNEYDIAWGLGIQWMRTGDRDYFDCGLEMARHYSSIDTRYGDFTSDLSGIVWEHSFNHVGTSLTLEQLRMPLDAAYLQKYGKSMFRGEIDPKGHIFEEGNWLYAAMTGDRFLGDAAERVCDNQAAYLTNEFDFGIARGGGWPLINAVAAYRHTSDPYYLNAARLMVQRVLERQDAATGGWYYYMPLTETKGLHVRGSKPFAVGILTYGMLRYLDVEPKPRPDARQALVHAADWLMHAAWAPGGGLRTATLDPSPDYDNRKGDHDSDSLLNAELVAFAHEETQEKEYLDFWQEMMHGLTAGCAAGYGKAFAQGEHQTIFGLDRIRPWIVAETKQSVPVGGGSVAKRRAATR